MLMNLTKVLLTGLFFIPIEAFPVGYLPSYELNLKRNEIRQGLPGNFLLETEISKNSYIYHGTSMENAIKIINSKQVIISGANNIGVNGRGWYFYNNLTFGMGYGSSSAPKVKDEGVVLPVNIKKDALILDWPSSKHDEFYQDILERYGRRCLSKKYI